MNASPGDWDIVNVYWSDGDSGRLTHVDQSNQRTVVRFRLDDVDAPETGGVGAAIGAAQCEQERERGFEAKKFVSDLTRKANVRIVSSDGYDRLSNPRLIVNLEADGIDVSQAAIAAGHLMPWPHEGSRASTPKPDWCL